MQIKFKSIITQITHLLLKGNIVKRIMIQNRLFFSKTKKIFLKSKIPYEKALKKVDLTPRLNMYKIAVLYQRNMK